jgi:phosphonopyruvate decarboxylase
VIEASAFHEALRRHGLTFFTGVPDSLLKDFCAYVTDHVPATQHVINANEGSAVALAAGHHLATGSIPVVYLQNSGTGNAINPLLSLADPAVYGIPMLLLIGWRGEPGTPDEPQHVTQGRIQERLLAALEVPYNILGPQSRDFDVTIERAVAAMRAVPRPHALLIRSGTFGRYALTDQQPAPQLTRMAAIELVLDALADGALVVATTGMTSREVFHLRELRGESHERDFLTVGSMGHSSQIALGLALGHPGRDVVCLDGDGSVLMHLGSLAIIGSLAPRNLRHIVLNNGAHDSVGGQPTAAGDIKLSDVARSCGYRSTTTIDTASAFAAAWSGLTGGDGPTMLEIRVASQARTEAGRPSSTPETNKRAFMAALRSGDA